jgi:DNA polymerase
VAAQKPELGATGDSLAALLAEVRAGLEREIAAGRGTILDRELGARLARGAQGAGRVEPTSVPPPLAAAAPIQSAAAAPIQPAASAMPVTSPSPAILGAAPAPDAAARAARLAELAERAAACTRCTLAGTRNRVVVGVGRLDPPLMLVGEAPGHDEDMQGEPFVGRAGQLLTRILGAMQLERAHVYIANVIKCRPPENRNPLPAEIAACSPFLIEQIELLRPRILCALGRYAASTLLQTHQSLAALRGKVHDFRGIPLVVTYHPSALLRYPMYKKPTWEDMQVVLRLMAGASAEEALAAQS